MRPVLPRVMRPGDVLELYATEGLKSEAVHKSKLKTGEGLVGTIAQQAIGLNRARLSVAIQRRDLDRRGPLDAVINSGHRQAAFVVDLLVRAGPDDLGIDQHARIVALFRGIDHDHALVHVDLRGGQARALGGVHGLEHVVDQLADAVVDLRHRLGDGVQARVGVTKNRKQGHV